MGPYLYRYDSRIFLNFITGNLKKSFIIIGVYVSYVSEHSALSSRTEIILIKSRIPVKPILTVMILVFSTVVGGFICMFLDNKLGRK